MVKRNSPQLPAAHSVAATAGLRFQPNRITAALLASLGVLPSWAVADANTITVHQSGGSPDTLTSITAAGGTVTNITTATQHGNTGFNSFGQFVVGKDNTVNLVLPTGASNLVNLVHDARAEINGTLNSVMDGKLGGNVIFADPHGLVVGASGVVNVGSLTVTTPSTAQMQTLLNTAKNGSATDGDATAASLMAGAFNGGTGEVKIQGQVNTISSINLFAASAVVASGATLKGGVSAADMVFASTVNLSHLSIGTDVSRVNGSVKIVGKNGVEVSGELAALMADNSGGSVQIASADHVNFNDKALVNTSGTAGNNAGNVIVEAPHINMASGSKISTTASGAGKAGNITLQALSDISCTFCGDDNTTAADLDDLPTTPKAIFAGSAGSATIALANGSTLDASHATDGTKAGAVTVQALATDQQLAGWTSANASITIDGLIKGRDIVIDAQSKAIIKPLWASSLLSLDNLTAFGTLYDSLNAYNRDDFKSMLASDPGNFSELLALQDFIGLQVVSSDAKVTIGATADLKASNNLSLTASSTRHIDSNINGKIEGINSLIPFGLGATYGSLSGTTSVEVANGAKLTAGKDLLLEATSDNVLDLDTKAVNSHDAGGSPLTTMGFAFGMAHSDIDTHVTVNRGAVVNVTGDITARSVAEQSLINNVSFEAIGLGASGGPAIALADYNSSTKTQFNAALTKGGNLNVSALDLIYEQSNKSEVKVGKGSLNFLFSKFSDPSISFITPKITDLLGIALDDAQPNKVNKLRFGSAVTLTQANHTAEALLGASGGTALSIDVSGDVSVQALQYQASLRNSASSTINSNVKEKDTTEKSVSVALVYSELNQNTRALIGDNVTVKASHIGVGAKNELPINDKAGLAFTGFDEWSSLGDVYSGLKDLVLTLASPGDLPSQYANSTGEADKLSLAGAVSVMKNDINAAAWVGDNSSLTTSGTGAWTSELWRDLASDGTLLKTWTLQTDNWSNRALASGTNNWAAPVSLLAENRVERLAVAGNFGIALFGSKSEKGTAVGAGLNIMLHDSSAVAGIGAGTQVTTQALSVAAKEKDLIIGISPSAGKGPSAAGNGSLVLALLDETVNASINNGATVKADRVDVDAKHSLGLWSASGALGFSEDTGVGIGIAVNQVDTDVQALIGDNRQWRALTGAGALGVKSTWTVDELDMQALSGGQSGAFSLAGGVARTDKEKQDSATANQDAAGGATSKAETLLGNLKVGVLNVWAEAKAKWDSVKNILDPDPTRTGDIPESALAAAGSASVNVSRQNTKARLADIVLDPRDPTAKGSKVNVLALNQTHQFAGSGAGALTLAKNGNQSQTSSALSGAIAANVLANVTTAEVANATLNNNDLLKVYAATDGDLVAMGLGLAVATSGSVSNDSKAISGSYAQFKNTTHAQVVNSTITGRTSAPSTIQVLAYDRSRSLIGGGAFAGAKGAGGSAYGASVTIALLANTISAEWLGSSASKFATLDVGAYSATQTLLAALGVAGTSGEAGAASIFAGYLDNQVTARVDGYTPSGGSLKKSSLTGGAVNVQARSVSDLTDLDSKFDSNAAGTLAGADLGYEDSLSSIDASATTTDGKDADNDGKYDGATTSLFDGHVSGEAVLGIAGSVAIGSKSAGGAAFGMIYAGSDYLASMGNVTTDLSGALKVEAFNATEVVAAAVGFAGSGKESSLGSGTAVIDRGTVTAQILGTAGAPLTIKAKTLDLSAQKAGGYYSLAGAIAFGGKGAIGGAVAITDIEQTVLAQLAYVTATLDGTANIIGAQQSQIRSVAVAGAAGSGGTAITGSVSYNRIAGATQALLSQSNFTGKALNLYSTQPGLSNSIWAAAGNVSLSDSGAAVGAAFATNLLTGTRSATLKDSTVNLTGDLNVQSGLDGEIYGIAVGGAGASSLGVNISSVNNVIQGKDYVAIENSTVTQTGGADLNVQASTTDGLTIGSLAGAVTYGGTGSFGAASAVNIINADRTAQITDSTVTGFDQATVRTAADQEINTIAVTAGGGGDVAVNGAVTTSVLKGTERATIVDSTLGANSLDVTVEGDRTINALAATVTGSGGLSVGAADANSLITVTREARIGTSTLNLADVLNVQAKGSMAVRSAAVGVGGAANAAVGASVAVNVLSGQDLATLTGVTLTGADTVNVLVEEGTATVKTLAGNVQGAGSGAGAGAVAVTQITQQRQALIENSSLALDTNATFKNIKVSALTSAQIDTLALSGAGAGTGAAVFSNTTNIIGAVTTAAIDTSTGNADNILISAKDTSTINSLAGGAVGAGSVAVGVAAAVNRITNQIEARLSGNKDLSAWTVKQLLVTAGSEASINAASISAGFSGTAAVSAGVASNLIKTSTKALIEDGARVKAEEDVGVLANNRDIIRSGAMVVAGSGNAAVAGLVTVNQMESTTEAGISGTATQVDALGGGTNGLSVDNGILTNAPDVNSWSDAQQFNPVLDLKTGLETVHGLAVRAGSLQQLGQLSLSTAVSLVPIASAAVSGLSNTSLVSGSTSAYIDGAKINQASDNASSANAAQQVSVAASSHSFTFGGVFSGAVSLGAAAVAAAIDTVIMDRSTTARLSGATVNSRGQTLVRANSTQAASDIVTTLGGGIVGVAGSGGVLILKGSTQALVNAGSTLNVGSLKLNATALNRLSPNAGTLSGGAVGVGASVGYASNQSLVRAWIGDQTTPTTRTKVASSGQIDVDASTNTGVRANAISGSGAGVAVAGSTTVVMLENTTEAGVGYADIGTSSTYAGGLSITAKDRLDALLTGGSVAIGGSSAGAAASVLVANSATRAQMLNSTAYLANALTVDAQREVDARLTTVTGSLSAGSSLGGSIGLLLLGSGVLTQEGSNPLDELDNGGNGTLSQSDKLSSRGNANLDYQAVNLPVDGSRATLVTTSNSSDTARLTTATTNVAVKSRLQNTNYKQETVARISASTVVAQGDSKVTASDKLYSSNLAGSVVAGGSAAFGAGIAYTLSNARVIAEVVGGSLTTGSLTLSALAQSLNSSPAVNVKAVTGAGGLGIGLGAAVGVAVLNNLVNANLAGTIASTRELKASASDKQGLDVQALGVTAGGLGGAGLVLGVAAHNSTVTTDVAAGSTLSGSDVSLSSSSQAPVALKAQGAAGGLLVGVNAAVVKASDISSATVNVGSNAKLTATNNLSLTAEASPQLSAETLSVALGGVVSAGASVIDALAKASSKVVLASGTQLQAKSATLSSQITQNGSNDTVNVHGLGVSGGLGVSANAVVATARNESTSLVQSDASSQFIGLSGGNWTFSAGRDVSQRAAAEGYAAGYYAVGATVANASASGSTQALVNGRFSGNMGTLTVSATGVVDNLATAVSGQGGLISGAAAVATTSDSSTTKASLYARGKDDTVANRDSLFQKVLLSALHQSNFNAFVDSINASLVGASGAHAGNSLNLTTSTELVGGSRINAYAYEQSAKALVTKAQSSDYNVKSGSGGVVDAAAGQSISTIALDTQSLIGAASYLHLIGDFRVPVNMLISAYNKVTAYDKVRLDSGGAIAIALAKSQVDVTKANAKVSVGANADMMSIGDIVLSGSGDYLIDTAVTAKTWGLAGAAQGNSLARVNANYDVVLGSNSTLLGYGDIRLYAGQTVSGSANQATLTARTDLWNNTAFPVSTKPNADATYTRNSNINVATGSQVNSVGDVFAYADKGWGNLLGKGVAKDLYTEALSALGLSVEIESGSATNTSLGVVRVDGALNSGYYNKRSVVIEGLDYKLNGVSKTLAQLAAMTLSDSDSITITPKVTTSDTNITYHMETGTYSQYITVRLDQLAKQLADYGLSPVERTAMTAEQTILRKALDALYTEMGGDTSTGATVAKDQDINIFVLDPILAKPGNVLVTGDALIGNGTLNAPGDAQITVTNNSSAFLRILGLEVPFREGGQLLFNDASMSTVSAINTANSSAYKNQAGFSKVTVSATSPDPVISVVNNYNPSTGVTGADGLRAPAPDIYVDGRIFNQRGLVSVEAKYGSIYANYDIRGKTLAITAGRDFVLNSANPFFHVGGDPATNYVTAADGKMTLTAPAVGSGTVVGNNVVITAQYLNINGLIQSGVPVWTVTIDNSTALTNTITAGQAAYDAKTGPSFVVLKSRNVRTGELGYGYDFSTKSIVLDSVEVAGGYMELTGYIMSTGNGQLNVLDGYSQVQIKNNTGYQIGLSQIDLGAGTEGTLRLNDVRRDSSGNQYVWSSIYTRDLNAASGLYNIMLRQGLSTEVLTKANVRITDGRTTTYTPVNDRTYTWLTGQDSTETTISKYYKDSFWGAFKVGEGTLYGPPIVKTSAERPIDGAEYMGSDGSVASGEVKKTTEKFDDGSDPRTSTNSWTTCEKKFIWCQVKRSWMETTVAQGKTIINRFTVAADNPINIQFTGSDTGLINVNSQGNVVLLGSLFNQNGNTTIQTNGALIQSAAGAVVQAKNLTIDANTGIGSAAQAVVVQVSGLLSAKSVKGDVVFSGRNGGLNISRMDALGGNLSIKAQGDITTSGGAVLRGHGVTLISTHGSVGSSGALVNIDTNTDNGAITGSPASFNASSVGGVFVNETSGDLLVDQVITGGDVHLKVANGDILDGNTSLSYDERDLTKLRALWADMGLTGAEADAALVAQKAQLIKAGQASYERYWNLRNGQVFDLDQVAFSSDQVAQMQGLGLNATQIAAEQTRVNADYLALHDQFGGAVYDSNFHYSLSATETAALDKTAKWSEDQLRYSLSSALVNRGTDTQVKVEKFNIQGANVTLEANRVGKVLANDVLVDLNVGVANLSQAQLAALGGAELDDVYVDDPSQPNKLRIVQRDDINVSASGTISVTAAHDVYLGGTQDFNIYNVQGDTVRIKTDGNIESARGSAVVITGSDVVLESSGGNIGGKGSLNINVSGDLTARAAKAINLTQAGNLSIQRLTTGTGALNLTVGGNLTGAGLSGEHLLAGGDINLKVGGNAGSASQRIQLNSQTDKIDLDVDGNAYVGGLQGANPQPGSLNIRTASVDGLLDIGQANNVVQSGNWTLGSLLMDLGNSWTMGTGNSVTAVSSLQASLGGNANLGALTVTAASGNLGLTGKTLQSNADGVLWQANAVSLTSNGTPTASGDIGAASRYLRVQGKDVTVSASGQLFLELAAGVTSGSLVSHGNLTLQNLGDLTLAKVQSQTGAVQLRGLGVLKIGELLAYNNIDVNGSGFSLATTTVGSDHGNLLMDIGGAFSADTLSAVDGLWSLKAASADIGAATVGTTGVGHNVGMTLTGDLSLDSLTSNGAWTLNAVNASIGNAIIKGQVDTTLSGDLQKLDLLEGQAAWNLKAVNATIDTANISDTADLNVRGDLKLASLTSGNNATLFIGSGSDIGALHVTGNLDLDVDGVLDLDSATSTGKTVLHHRGLAGTALRYGDLDVGGTLDVNGLGNWTGHNATAVGDATYDVGSADLHALTSTTGKLSLKAVGLFAADALDSDASLIDLQSGSADLGVVNAFTTLTSLTNGDLTIAKGYSNGDMKLTTKPGSLGTIRFGVLADPLDPTVLDANNWHLKTAENLFVETDGDVFGGNAEANKQLVIKGRNLFFGRVQSLDEDVFLQATGLLNQGHGNITGLKVEAKRDVSIIANGDMSMPEVKFGGKYSLKAGRDLTVGVGGNLDLNGDAEAGRDLTFVIGGAVNLTNVTAGRDASITSGKAITIGNRIQAGGNVTLNAQDGDITVGDMTTGTGGIVSTGLPYDGISQKGNVLLTASGNITTPTIVSGAGAITATSGGQMKVNDLASASFIDLLARGLIEVKGTSSSVGNQTWRSTDDSIFFDRLVAGGQVLLDSLTNTQGRELASDGNARINAGWRNGVATTASILLTKAMAPTLSLFSGNLIRVADASIGNSVDLHGADIELYGRHTGAGQLNLWVEGSGATNANRFVTKLTAADIVSPHLHVVDSTITTSGDKVDLRDASGVDFLKLYTSAATVLMDNLTPLYQPDADVQLYELDKAFQLKQVANTTTTDAYVLHRKYTHLVLLTNFSETHAPTPAETGVVTQRTTAASFSEGQMSRGLALQRLASILNNFQVGKAPEAAWKPNWSQMRMDTRMNMNDSQQPQYSVVPGQDDTDGAAKWDL